MTSQSIIVKITCNRQLSWRYSRYIYKWLPDKKIHIHCELFIVINSINNHVTADRVKHLQKFIETQQINFAIHLNKNTQHTFAVWRSLPQFNCKHSIGFVHKFPVAQRPLPAWSQGGDLQLIAHHYISLSHLCGAACFCTAGKLMDAHHMQAIGKVHNRRHRVGHRLQRRINFEPLAPRGRISNS